MAFQYISHEWVPDELITKEKLNNLETVGQYVASLKEIAETGDYADLIDKPKINGHELVGDLNAEDLNLQTKLPTASADTLGAIKVGEKLSIDEDGKLSVNAKLSDFENDVGFQTNTDLEDVVTGGSIEGFTIKLDKKDATQIEIQLPQNLSEFTNDGGFQSKDEVTAAIETARTASTWYSGTALSGTDVEQEYSSTALIGTFNEGDYYLNSTEGYVYRCNTPGKNEIAKWKYQGSIKGAPGAKGETGTGLDLKGTYESEEALNAAHPSENNNGDTYLVQGSVYVWSDGKFTNAGEMQGPPGATGPAGPAGPTGDPGASGATFTPSLTDDGLLTWSNDKKLPNPPSKNIMGPAGPQGLQGLQGITGERGPKGDQGTSSRWHAGTALDTTGNGISGTADINGGAEVPVGDMYLNTSTSNVYRCVTAGAGETSKWDYVCCIKGLTGSAGPQGPAGSNGTNGAKGDTGAPGIYYYPSIDGEGKISWTKKEGTVASELPATVSVRGPAGPAGAAGKDGAAGSPGAAGPAGTSIGTITVNTDSLSSNSPSCSVVPGGVIDGKQSFTLNFTGLKGATGPQGPAGAQGPIGPQGPAGTASTNATKLVASNNSNYYLYTSAYTDYDAVKFYGGSSTYYLPKYSSSGGVGGTSTPVYVNSSGNIVACTANFQGPIGPVGPTGPAGPTGPKGDTGTFDHGTSLPSSGTTGQVFLKY